MTPPYYIVPDVEQYRRLDPNSEEAKILSRRIAINIGDLASLRLILGIDPPEFARFYPDMETPAPTTMDTIDAFLDKFGSKLPPDPLFDNQEAYVLEEIPAQPEEEKSRSDEISLSSLLKEQRYDDALQFIERQNLNNPQKSIYFALQIRFIKKLKSIQTYKNKTKS